MSTVVSFSLGIVIGALITTVLMFKDYTKMYEKMTDAEYELLVYKLRDFRGDENEID